MKGEMDLDDHHASCPSYQDLVSIFRPCPTWRGQVRSMGIGVKESSGALSVRAERTLPRCRVRYPDSLILPG